ncbi:hypothetical protein HMI54_009455 [Coelomomyces lativittatus]|nr:hypothetical protein HMI54_009455 [Coelomomyces lativittatus]
MLKKVYLKEDAFHSRTAQKLIDEEDSYFELGLENRSITSLNFSIMQLEQLKCQIFGFIQHIKKKPMPPTIYQRITEPYPYHLQSSLILNRLFENIPWNQKNVFPPDPWLLTLFHSNLKDSKPTFRLSNLLSIRAKPIISETNIQQHHELLLKCIKNHTSEFFSAFPRTAGSKSDLNMPLLYQYQGMILDGVSFSLQSHSLCFPQIFSDRCSKLRKNHPSYQEKYEKNENFLDMRMGPGPILDISLILSHSSIVKKH